MSDHNQESQASSGSEVDNSRRELLRRIASLGLGHIALIHLGGGASAFTPSSSCPGPSGQDLDCAKPASTPQGYETDDTCGVASGGPNGETFADSSCNFKHGTTGEVEKDEDCGLPGGVSEYWFDHDCASLSGDGTYERDNDCAILESDQDCGLVGVADGGHHVDNDCDPVIAGSDADCRLSVGIGLGFHKDHDCGDQSGSVSPDLDCGLLDPFGNQHTDDACGLLSGGVTSVDSYQQP